MPMNGKSFIITVKNKVDRHFPRISYMPFGKWYVKCYSIFADFKKIFEAKINNDPKGLNKNQKIKYGRIKSVEKEII